MKKYLALIIILTLVVPLFFACTSSTTPATNPAKTAPAPSGNAVTMSNFAFSPATLTVKAGTTVTWTNKDSATHTATSDTGAFDSGNLSKGATFSYTFNTSGTFAYHCTIHPSMKGTIIVE